MDAARALFRTATGGLRPAQCMLIGALMGVPLVCAAAASALPPPGTSAVPLPRTSRVGQAGIYRLDGRTTASGELYNRNALTAAHRSLPFGTIVRVTNLRNQRTVIVRINDRGTGAGNGLIDLTPRAAALIGLHGIDVGQVRVDVVGSGGVRDAPPPPDGSPADAVK